MSIRTISIAGARVVALVLVTTMVTLTLGVMAPGVEMASESTSAEYYRPVAEAPNARDAVRPNRAPPFGRASASGPELAAIELPRDSGMSGGAIVEISAAAPPSERFSGEGAGRKHAVVARDPYNRRAYLLESASLLQRRGWIGLSSNGGTTDTGGSGGLRWSEDHRDAE
jgi:hypothetical protein